MEPERYTYSNVTNLEDGKTTDGKSAPGARASGAERRSPALQLSEVEEILEHSAMVPQLGEKEKSSAVFVGSTEGSERYENDTHDTSTAESSTATEEEGAEDGSDTMTESQENVLASAEEPPRRTSILDGFWACISPVASFWKGREKRSERADLEDEFEIAFADIKELEFVGSGAQGAVFSGVYRGEKMAVKKVRDKSYCNEICQLRKLTHCNIVQLR